MAYKTCPDCGSRMFEHGCVNCNERDYISMQDDYVPPIKMTGQPAPTSQPPSNSGDKNLTAMGEIFNKWDSNCTQDEFCSWFIIERDRLLTKEKDDVISIDELLSEFKRQGIDTSNWDGDEGAEKAIVDGVRNLISESPASLPRSEGKGMSAEEILELHFGSDYWILKEKELLPNILSAMEHYASQRQSGFTVEFAEWIGTNGYTKHQINNRWYDSEIYIGTIEELYTAFLSSLKKQNEQK